MPAGAVAALLAPDARRTTLTELMDAVIGALRDQDGIPVDRASCSLAMLHPEVRSTQVIWEAGVGARSIKRTHDAAAVVIYTCSPNFGAS